MKSIAIIAALLCASACSSKPDDVAEKTASSATVRAGTVLDQKVQQHRFTLIDKYGDRNDQHRVILDRTTSDRGKGGLLYDVDAKGDGTATRVRTECTRKLMLLGGTVAVDDWRPTTQPAKGHRVEARRSDYAKTLCARGLDSVTEAATMSQLPGIAINLQILNPDAG